MGVYGDGDSVCASVPKMRLSFFSERAFALVIQNAQLDPQSIQYYTLNSSLET